MNEQQIGMTVEALVKQHNTVMHLVGENAELRNLAEQQKAYITKLEAMLADYIKKENEETPVSTEED